MNRTPTGTWTLLLVYGVIFLAFDLLHPAAGNLVAAGALDAGYVAAGDYWRLVSAAFVHVGLLHIAFNGYFLYMVGPALERELGLERFLLVYLLTAVGGNVAVCLLYAPGQICAGGSGALFGFLGALVGLLLRQEHSYRDFLDNRAGRQLLVLIFVNLLIGWVVPEISNTAHVGGLVTGFAVALLWLRLPEAGQRLAGPRPLPAVAFALLFGTLTWVACRPVVRTWYEARALWFAEEPGRARRIRDALLARGIPASSLAMLELGRYYRDHGDGRRAPVRLRAAAASQPPWYVGLLALAVDPEDFNRFIDRLKDGSKDPGRALPADPWLHHEGG